MKENKPFDGEPLNSLTPELMKGYANGTLSPRQRQRVEQFLENHPFEAEAMEGLKSTTGDFSPDLMELEDRLADRTRSPQSSNFRYVWPMAAAVSLLAISGLLFYYFMPESQEQSTIATTISTDSSSTPANDILTSKVDVPENEVEAHDALPAPTEKVANTGEIEGGKNTELARQAQPEPSSTTPDGLAINTRSNDYVEPPKTKALAMEEAQTATDADQDLVDEVNEDLAVTEPLILNQQAPSEEPGIAESRGKTKKEGAPAAVTATARNYDRSTALPLAQTPKNLDTYLKQHTNYPESARNQGVEGSVKLSFVVNIDSSLSDIQIISPLGHGCDQEAIRVLTEGPQWYPAHIGGNPVKSRGEIEINFSATD